MRAPGGVVTDAAAGRGYDADVDSALPLVSIVIPTHARPTFLARAVGSALGQTHGRLEVLVVDDNDPASPERAETERAMAAFAEEPRVRYLRRPANGGGGAARNTGIEAARGDFVAFLDDDDEWEPDKIERQLAVALGSELEPGVVYCGIRHVDDATGEESLDEPSARGDVLPALLRRNVVGTTSTVLVRREALTAVGGFDPRWPALQDYDLYVRLAQRVPFDFVAAPLVRRHIHPEDRISARFDAVADANERFLEQYRPLIVRDRDAYRYRLLFNARWLIVAGRRETARRRLLRAWRLAPLDPLVYAYLLYNELGGRWRRGALRLRDALGIGSAP